MLKCFNKITRTSGIEWLLENDPELRSSTAPKITNLRGLARRILDCEDRPCGSVRFDLMEDGGELELAAQEQEEVETWRCAELGPEFEALLDLVREEGTAGLSARLNCTQRNVQQKLKKLVEQGMGQDLLSGEVVR